MSVRSQYNQSTRPTQGVHTERRKTALVVEDDKSVSLVLDTLLVTLGFDVFKVATAEDADIFLSTLSPDLILLDLGLPGRSGEDWLRSFRKTIVDTPVIAVSGVNDPLRKAAVLRDGADDFVSKPFQVAELEARICALLRRPKSMADWAICEGRAYLNPRRCELRVGSVRQSLTIREFGILWHLALHEGRWVDPKELSEAILLETVEPHTENMRVHVSNLRRKLNHFAHVFVIESERLVGYRITCA